MSVRIVQSTWFPDKSSIAGRWSEEKFMLFNLALSFTSLTKFYENIDLYTDSAGYDLLVEKLGLKYSRVFLDLEQPGFSNGLTFDVSPYWVLKKLYIYSLQKDPFIHVDNDIYLFDKLNENLLRYSLCAQNIEIHSYYLNALIIIKEKFKFVPDWLKATATETCHAVNAGILGGMNHTIFHAYFLEAINFLETNKENLHLIEVGVMNTFLEQCMFKMYADYYHQKFSYQINFVYKEKISYNAYKIHDAPKLNKYIHVMNCKSNATVEEAISKTLYYEDIKLFAKCQSINKSRRKNSKQKKISRRENFHNLFYRTLDILAQMSDKLHLSLDNIDTIKSSVEAMKIILSEKSYEILLDVFYFEHQRYEFNKIKRSIASHYRHFVATKRAMDGPLSMNLFLSLSENAKILSTRWLWVENNEFLSSKPHRFENRLSDEPGYFETILYHYFEKNILKEQELDPINCLIMRYVNQGLCLGKIIDTIKRNLIFDGTSSDLDIVFESRIRYFVHQGALVLSSG